MAASKNTTKLTTRQAIEQVLTGKRGTMTVAEIAEAGIPLTNLAGKTPKQTFYSILYGENKKSNGLVVKVGKGGVFKLNPRRKVVEAKAPAKAKAPATKKGAAAKAASPAPRGRSAAKLEQLRAAYLYIFDSFATGRTEVAEELGVSKATASKLLNELRTLGLVDGVDVNDESQGRARKGAYSEIAWQAWQTYDSIDRPEAERLFNAAIAPADEAPAEAA